MSEFIVIGGIGGFWIWNYSDDIWMSWREEALKLHITSPLRGESIGGWLIPLNKGSVTQKRFQGMIPLWTLVTYWYDYIAWFGKIDISYCPWQDEIW